MDGGTVLAVPSGRVNLTFLAEGGPEPLILQKINPVFKSSRAPGDNWAKVEKTLSSNGIRCPRVLPDKFGNNLALFGEDVWRLTSFVPGTVPGISESSVFEAARTLGSVHRALNSPMPVTLDELPKGVEYTNGKLPAPGDFSGFRSLYRRHPGLEAMEEALKRGEEAVKFLPGSPVFRMVFLFKDLAIHGDPKRTNFLWEPAVETEKTPDLFEKTGTPDEDPASPPAGTFTLIDWDTAALGDPLLDLGELMRSFAVRKTAPFFDADLGAAAVGGYSLTGLCLDPARLVFLPAVIRGLVINLARRYLADALLENYFVWDEKPGVSRFERALGRAESLLDLAWELFERDYELSSLWERALR
ncbi:MAG: aminoglycoside phosphotransferase family protein [Deltaproteobacteria bacterium]|nr:aminoglycoside phosphotransferase family protein [Deltaproteobacteria bacterium]